MIKKLFILFFVAVSASVTAQGEAANWYFGYNGGLDFNSGSPISQPNGQLASEEACASISDSTGNLLFYTDGVVIYGANHVLMPNGSGLWGHTSTTQGAIIIPQPGNSNRYYVFTQDAQGGVKGLAYTVVDMTLNGGMGDVIFTQKNIQLSTPTTEKITAVFHANGEDIWVIAHVYGTNEFLAYLVTSSGVSIVPIVSAVGEVATVIFGAGSSAGNLKMSPNGKKIASAKQAALAGLELFDFDASGGIVSNAQKINTSTTYGVEFSSDSKVLYCSSTAGIKQYDITQPNLSAIQASEVIMASGSQHGALQLGIDGKIYAARYLLNSLSVITNPGILGLGCNFMQDATLLSFNTESGFGLPSFITSYFQFELAFKDLCSGLPTQMEIITPSTVATASWDFGDPGSGANNTSTTIQPNHIYNISGTYTVTVIFTTDLGQSITLTGTVTIIASPTAHKPANLITCDALPNDSFASFALSGQTATILGTQPASGYSVAYYASEEMARTENTPLPLTYTNTSTPQTIYARITNTTTGCFALTDFTLTVNPLPEVTDPDDQEACEETAGTGIAHFDLTQSIPQITGGNMNLGVKFYKIPANVINNISITTPTNYSNTTPNAETVYFQVIDPAAPDCKVGGSLDLVVNGQPLLNTAIPTYKQCDYNNAGDGIEVFDLTTMYGAITSAPGLILIYEYESAGARVIIPNPTAFTNTIAGQQTIYVSTTNSSGCKKEVSFLIEVNPLPALNLNTNPFYACEEVQGEGKFELTKITQWLTSASGNYVVKYYLTQLQAETGDTNNLSDPHITSPSTIYARLENSATGCVIVAPVILDVLPAPIAATPAPLEECDFNGDGFTIFNLNTVIQDIQNALGNVVVTVHLTVEDASFGTNVITNTGAFQNVNQHIQTLFIRVQSSQTECFDIVTLQLIVNPVPEATTPSDYALCDDGVSDTDGQATFDLSTKAGEIYGTIDPTLFSLDFYPTATDAANATNIIANPLSYLTVTRTVYARVTNNATGCYDVVALNLIVNPLPVLITNQYVYRLCETEDPVEIETFDLTSTTPKFLLNQDGIEVTYYHTFADANAHTNPILNDTAYQNNGSPGAETLFVRFTIEATGCYRIGFLDVDVDPEPIILVPTQDELTVCDTNGQGIGEFNLDALIADMANGEPFLDITFHETLEDAQSGLHAITNTANYTTVGTPQTLWVRVSNSRTGCVNNTPFVITLVVEPAPQSPALEDLTFCDDTDNNGQDGKRQVDLTVQNAVISAALGLTIPQQLTVEYYTSGPAAELGIGRIINPAAFMAVDGQQIWVRVEALVTECYSVEDFFLHFNKPHALTTPPIFAKCNEALPNDGITTFDLTTMDDVILGPSGVSQGYTVNYYTTSADAHAGTNVIANPTAYTNPGPPTGNPKTLFVEVITTQGCKSYTTLTVKVLPLPVPNFAPTALSQCDDTAPAGTEPFNLTDAADEITANGSNYILSYYATIADAEAGTNPIADPTAYESGTGEVYVRVEIDTHNPLEEKCHQVVTLDLILNPLPPVADLDDYTHCQADTTQAYAFDIQKYVNDALGTTGNYDVDYFTDAALTTPAIPVNGYVVTGSATVYVRVVNLDTGCTIVKALILRVEQEAIANPVTQLPNECDYFGANDGITNTWDLTQVEAQVLGGQDPNVFIVTYHDTNADDAEEGLNPIATPQAYTNLSPTQTIWITVTNSSTQAPCRATTEMTIVTELLPVPVITGGTICVDKSTDAVVRPLLIDTGLDGATHSFQWFHDNVQLPDTGSSILAQAEGSYTVIATSASGCVSDLAGPAVVVKSGPAVKVDRGYYVSNYFSDSQTITVTIDGYGNYEYSLDEGPWQTGNIFANVSPGSHTVRVRDTNADACDELVITDASIVDYPNFFTPNGDGFHDTWNIIGLANTGSVIYIFDRYGKLLKQVSPDDGGGWDGTFNGINLPADDYWFTVTYPEFNGTTSITREFKSHFSLKR